MHQFIRETFNKILPLPEPEWLAFETILKPINLNKRDYLLQQGEICKGIYYLQTGVIRTFSIIDGKEVNKAFHFDNEFLREIESLVKNIPSENSIQALEDSRLYLIEKTKLINLYKTSPVFQELGRKILEEVTITEQKYAFLLSGYSPEQRYLQILKHKPELIHRVPLQHLASYLGITKETLSRIRNRIS